MKRVSDDTELVHRARSGDGEAFAELVRHYQEPIFLLVRRTLGDDELARELTQDVFVKVYENLIRFDFRAAFSTWLYRIACNMAVSAVRRRRQHFVPVNEQLLARIPDEAVDTLFASGASDARVAALNRAIGRLAPDERALVTLFYFEEQPLSACAAILSMTENNAKVRLHRIRKKLYTLMNEYTDER